MDERATYFEYARTMGYHQAVRWALSAAIECGAPERQLDQLRCMDRLAREAFEAADQAMVAVRISQPAA